MSMSDPVNFPHHYTRGEIECIDAMTAAYGPEAVRMYAKCAAFKYQWRADHKGTGEQDMDKAIWYLRFAKGDDPRKDRSTTTRAADEPKLSPAGFNLAAFDESLPRVPKINPIGYFPSEGETFFWSSDSHTDKDAM
jgi:hypothetical protein